MLTPTSLFPAGGWAKLQPTLSQSCYCNTGNKAKKKKKEKSLGQAIKDSLEFNLGLLEAHGGNSRVQSPRFIHGVQID